MSDVNIENVGPIESLAIKIPEEGGVVVFRGHNGAGKSVAIDAVDSLLGGKRRGNVSLRDTAMRGSVEGWGAKLTVSRSARISGELEVDTLEGRLSLADFISPKVKDPAAADAARIKALVQISGQRPDLATFRALLGDDWDEIVTLTDADEGLDPVELAGKVKRACEAAARKAEKRAEILTTTAKGQRSAVEDVDTECETNDLLLRGQHSDATQALADARGLVAAKAKAEAARAEAKEKLAEAQADGVSLADLEKIDQEQQVAMVEAIATRDELKARLAKAEAVIESQIIERAATKTAIETAKKHAEHLATWERVLDAEAIEAPSDEEVAALAAKVAEAQKAIEAGAIARQALGKIKSIENTLAEAKDAEAEGERYRDAAKGTDDILSDIVSEVSVLTISGGRLIHQTQRGPTFFAELSDGERTALGTQIAVDAVGDGGVLVLRQDFWEGLDPDNRAEVVKQVKRRKVVVLTAEAAAGDIRSCIEEEGAA